MATRVRFRRANQTTPVAHYGAPLTPLALPCIGYAVPHTCLACGAKSSAKTPGWCSCGLDNAWVDDCDVDTRPGAPSALVRADQISVPDIVRRHTATPFDIVLGGGVPSHAALLIWGKSGSGKTRLAAQLCKALTPAVFVSLEMPEDDTTRLLSAFGADLSRVWVTRERDWRSHVLRVNPRLALIDSISVFGYGADDEMHQAYEFAHETGITVACVCHATVAGKSKGGTGPVHWSDAAIVVRAKGKGRVTVDTPSKNRFGPTGPGRPVGRGSII